MINVYLFSGFLGSGKTSFLLHAIQQLKAEGKKPAVFMNEFGNLPIDSDMVGKDDVPLKEVLDGCICCSGAEKTEAQLQGLLLEHDDIDVILIETTGVAHPVEALDAVYSPLFADQLRVKGILTVVDSKLWLNRETLSPKIRALFHEQIRHGIVLLANKSDLLDESELATVTMELSQYNEAAPIYQTVNGKIDFSLIEKAVNKRMYHPQTSYSSGANLPLSSKVLPFKESVSMEAFEKWVQSLPDTVYRMKGFVPVSGTSNPYLFQYAYGVVNWMPEYIRMEPKLVIIGEGIDDIEYSSN